MMTKGRVEELSAEVASILLKVPAHTYNYSDAAKTKHIGDIAIMLAATCLALYEREERLLAAAQGLVDKLAAIEDDPRYKSVWTINQLHVGPYSGPTYVNELDTLRAALKAEEKG